MQDKRQYFHNPVIGVPQYDEVISQPMDFQTMEDKLDRYTTVDEFKVLHTTFNIHSDTLSLYILTRSERLHTQALLSS